MEQKVVNVLWVSPRELDVINDGARQATHMLLQSFIHHNTQLKNKYEGSTKFNVNLLMWTQKTYSPDLQEKIISSYGLHQLYIYKRSFNFINKKITQVLFAILSLIFKRPFSTFYFFSMTLFFKNIFGWSNQYDLIVFDAPHGAISFINPINNRFLSKKSKYIFRAHNLETELWKKEIKFRKKIFSFFLAMQAQFMKSLEKTIVLQSQHVACVSLSDVKKFNRFFVNSKACFVPISFDFGSDSDSQNQPDIRKENESESNSDNIFQNQTWPSKNLVFQSKDSLCFGFFGKLDWLPNLQGLIWFLKNVWPNIKKLNGVNPKLIIAGSGKPTTDLENLISAHSNINFLGYVQNVNDFYDKVDVVLIPVFYGGGTRVKAIEAILKKKLIMSTRLGVNGLNLIPKQDYLDAENTHQWISQLSLLLYSQNPNPMDSKTTELKNEEFQFDKIGTKKLNQITNSAFEKLKQDFDTPTVEAKWISLIIAII